MPLTISPWSIIKPSDLRANPLALFVFGDNFSERGRAGQAHAMRGKPNSIGLPTKHTPSMAESAFFSNHDLQTVQLVTSLKIERLHNHITLGHHVIWPRAGIGTGLAQLSERAPFILAFYEGVRFNLEQLNRDYPATEELR